MAKLRTMHRRRKRIKDKRDAMHKELREALMSHLINHMALELFNRYIAPSLPPFFTKNQDNILDSEIIEN